MDCPSASTSFSESWQTQQPLVTCPWRVYCFPCRCTCSTVKTSSAARKSIAWSQEKNPPFEEAAPTAHNDRATAINKCRDRNTFTPSEPVSSEIMTLLD